MLSALGDALKVTVFGMAIVFAMLIIIILAVKFIEPVRRFFAGLFKRDKKESSPAKGDSAGSNANTADPGTGAVDCRAGPRRFLKEIRLRRQRGLRRMRRALPTELSWLQ